MVGVGLCTYIWLVGFVPDHSNTARGTSVPTVPPEAMLLLILCGTATFG